MYEVILYRNEKDDAPIEEYINTLSKMPGNKNARIKLKKIFEYIGLLRAYGVGAGMPAVKHITGTDLWELRPTSDRIFFAYWKDNTFILLHHFAKKTQKTPPREIDQALRNLKDFLERNEKNEQKH